MVSAGSNALYNISKNLPLHHEKNMVASSHLKASAVK